MLRFVYVQLLPPSFNVEYSTVGRTLINGHAGAGTLTDSGKNTVKLKRRKFIIHIHKLY